jgi:hypothetical protein
MPDPQSTTQTEGAGAPAPAADPAPSPAAKTFTQEQLDAIVQERLARDRQARTQQQAPQAPAAAPLDEAEMTPKQMREAFAEMKARDEFRDLADELGLAREGRADLFDLMKVQKPTDKRAWLEKKAPLFGGKAASTVSQTPPQDPPKPPAAAPSAPSKVDPTDSNGLVNLFALSEQQVAAMSPAKVREHFDKILEYAHSQSGAPTVPRPSNRKG